MNLDVFNRVNLKDSTEGKGMYSEWASLSPLIQNNNEENHSVLGKFGIGIGKEVAIGVVKQLASNLGITQAAEPSPLNNDREVQWCMEVICFGLTLPLSEHETIKDCVNVYCEWLSALLPIPKICVPQPVCEDPNLYARKIIGHFHNLFVPRKGEGVDTINRQAVLCHRVLRTLQQLAHESSVLNRETWESLLLFLLAINDTLLSPPTVRDDVADQLCERVLSVLFEIWLIACAKCFPSPPLWKTLRESCMNWRHRIALIEQWNRINLALTARVLEFMYGPTFPELKIGEEDLIPVGISNDCIAQSWFRFLHCLGNPISLCRPEIISQTPKFLQFAITSDSVMDPCQHPCLQILPMIFLKAVKGIAGQVDAFLGIAQPYSFDDVVSGGGGDKSKDVSNVHNAAANATTTITTSHSPTPPPHRRLAKSFSVAPSTTSKGIPRTSLIALTSSRITSIQPSSISSSGPSSNSSQTSMSSLHFECRTPLAQARPKCNSILHLFGEWLFEAAFIGCDVIVRNRLESDANKRPNSLVMDTSKGSLTASQPNSLSDSPELSSSLTIDKYESGRAEAIGALSRIFCAKKTGEEILPVYLARFYLALHQGLKIPLSRECGETLISILLNSSDLFRLDLDGVQVLTPAVISALELVLPEKDPKLTVSKIELRRASIHLLLSMLVLPLHFQNLPIRDLCSSGEKLVTFAQLKPRLMNLLMNALQVESDPQNTHMLLGGLLLCVQDSSELEMVEQVAQPDCPVETASNLLSSVSDTASMGSATTGSANTNAVDYHSLPDEIAQGFTDIHSHVPVDSAHALFVRATYLVCHRLISSWKGDLNVSLAALELLSGLARIQIRESDALECKRAVKWLCDYIVYQCSRPPPAHSKDLHSTIVAAFQCCATWLLEHPYLLQDKDCLNTVLEVVELGVSGTKSVGKPGEQIRLKDSKELKPASMRVRDAAESLLTCILEQVGYFPSECGAESLSSLLDEVSLLKHCNSWPGECTDQQIAVERFRYFVAEGSIMLALLEEPLGNDQDPQPTITVLIRGPFGRHAWTMQLRHLPRHRSGTKYHAPNPGRPVSMQDMSPKPEVKQKYFPDSVDRITQCKVDQSIPTMEAITFQDPVFAEETAKLSQLLERQTVSETNINVTVEQNEAPECVPPPVCHEYQTARLFLSHFGFLRFDKNEEFKDSSAPTLIALDSSANDFCKDLMSLDSMSSRTCDTVHVFYVRAEQHAAHEIVSNVLHESTVSPQFLDFLLTLGWPVDVGLHPGWSGHITTSWRVSTPTNIGHIPDHGGSLFDGQSQVLYWADACTEVAFVLPSKLKRTESQSTDLSFNSSFVHSSWYNVTNENLTKEKPRTLSLDLDKNIMTSSSTISLTSGSSTRRSTARQQSHPQTNTKIMVVWLESYEDHLQLPIGYYNQNHSSSSDLLPYMNTGLETTSPRPGDCFIIFLHRLNSDLLRIHLQGPTGKMNLATPLVDGMVVSRRSLGPLVRQTALNMSRRRRLDNDVYQPPHVRRRMKVQEIVQKYKREMSEPELLTYLFSNP